MQLALLDGREDDVKPSIFTMLDDEELPAAGGAPDRQAHARSTQGTLATTSCASPRAALSTPPPRARLSVGRESVRCASSSSTTLRPSATMEVAPQNRGTLPPSRNSSRIERAVVRPSSCVRCGRRHKETVGGPSSSCRPSTMLTTAQAAATIKPNPHRRPDDFDGHFVLRQLRPGVAAVVAIQRSGYPVSLPHGNSNYGTVNALEERPSEGLPAGRRKPLQHGPRLAGLHRREARPARRATAASAHDWIDSKMVQIGKKSRVYLQWSPRSSSRARRPRRRRSLSCSGAPRDSDPHASREDCARHLLRAAWRRLTWRAPARRSRSFWSGPTPACSERP